MSEKNEWKPIDSAPDNEGRPLFCELCWGPEGDQSVGSGFRLDGKWYAAGVFYCLGQEKRFEIREVEVQPTHWRPRPDLPDEESHAPSAPGDAQDERQAFEAWLARRGVWPALCFEEVFIAGWNARPADAPAAGDALERQYTSAMGVAGQRYMDRFPYAHALPAGFRWEDLWNTMQNAASPASHTARDADVSTLLSFIFERFGQPGDAGELPDSVVAAVRRLERAALAAQVPQQDKGEA